MGGWTRDDAKLRRLGEDGHLTTGQHSGVHPADEGEAQVAVLNPGDHQADLIQVSVQQQPFGVGLPTAAHADDIAQPIRPHLVHPRSKQLCCHSRHMGLITRGASCLAQPFQTV